MKKTYSAYGKVKMPKPFLYNLYSGVMATWLKTKAKLKVDIVDPLPEQFVLVGNHPSGFDNFYCIDSIKPKKICFVANRYYLFNKTIGGFFRAMGSIPKSLFTSDMESVKNTLAMKEMGANLGFMPEVRLCMDGEMQKLPESTGKFIKMLKLPVYICHFDGSYLVKPKWSKYRRRGVVEIKIKKLYDQQELANVSAEEMQKALEKALYYNDFEWLKQRPNAKYRCKKQAEGLEKILTVCPHCGKKHEMETKGNKLSCKSCGYTVLVNDRYEFVDDGFKHYFDNLQEWYRWIKKDIWQQIDDNPDYQLTEEVLLKVPSTDGKTFLREGGKGKVTLNKDGLTFVGTLDGKEKQIEIPMHDGFYLTYGMNIGFQTFVGAKEYYAFCPDNVSKSLDWYLASERFTHNFVQKLKENK